jgi:uncharacterized protein
VSAAYVDTSALAKWYLNEPGSEAFEAFITRRAVATISRLTVVEFRCLLARRRRAGELSAEAEIRAYRLFEGDLRRGHLDLYALDDFHAIAALGLLERLAATHPLRTLDALHLAIALEAAAPVLATADRVMAEAAIALGLEVVTFG